MIGCSYPHDHGRHPYGNGLGDNCWHKAGLIWGETVSYGLTRGVLGGTLKPSEKPPAGHTVGKLAERAGGNFLVCYKLAYNYCLLACIQFII